MADSTDQIGRAPFYIIDWDDLRKDTAICCPIFGA